MKPLFIVIVIIAILGVGLLLAGPKLKEAVSGLNQDQQGTTVRSEVVTIGSVTEIVQAPGEIEPRTKVEISAQVSARIIDLPHSDGGPLRAGKRVKKGEVVARLNDKDWKAALDAATASRAAAERRIESERNALKGLEQSLEYAKRRQLRQEALFETGDIAEQTVDDTRERVDDLNVQILGTEHQIAVLEFQLENARAEIVRAEENLANTTVIAPMDGVVTSLNVEVGQTVLGTTTNAGTVMMTIADMSSMVMNARIAENDIAHLRTDLNAKVYINAYEDEIFGGRVSEIAVQRTAVSQDSGHFDTEIEVDLNAWREAGNPIKSGLQANVDIEIERHEGIVVPSQAIVERLVTELPEHLRDHALVDHSKKVTRVVYRIENGKAVCTPVRVGASDLTHTILTEGVEDGEELIVGPYAALESVRHDHDLKIEGEDDAEADDAGTDADTDESTDDAETTDAD